MYIKGKEIVRIACKVKEVSFATLRLWFGVAELGVVSNDYGSNK